MRKCACGSHLRFALHFYCHVNLWTLPLVQWSVLDLDVRVHSHVPKCKALLVGCFKNFAERRFLCTSISFSCLHVSSTQGCSNMGLSAWDFSIHALIELLRAFVENLLLKTVPTLKKVWFSKKNSKLTRKFAICIKYLMLLKGIAGGTETINYFDRNLKPFAEKSN